MLAISFGGCGNDDGGAADTGGAESTGAVASTGGVDASAGSSADTSTATSGTSGSDADDTAQGACQTDADCLDPAAAACIGGVCVSCDVASDPDGACAGFSAVEAVCDGGVCVACPEPLFCTSEPLACSCAACTSHADCGDAAACDVDTGLCLTDVVYVDSSVRCPGLGTADDPLCSIMGAIDFVGVAGIATIRIRPGAPPSYVEDIVPLPGQTLALTSDEAAIAVVQGAPGGEPSILTVPDASTTVYVDRLRLRANAAAPAIRVTGGYLHAQRIELAQNEGGGIIARDGATVVLENSMIADWDSDVPGLDFDDATLTARYLSFGYAGAGPSLVCTDSATVSIRNSLVVSYWGPDWIDCPTAVLAASVRPEDVGQPPGDFVWFENHVAGDLHLRPEGAAVFADYAQWNTGDPATDIDGDPRPRVDGTPDFPGADVPVAR